jgi:hypothetical protein
MLWDDITGWMHAPFQRPLDPVNWVLLVILSATIAYGWSRVLNNVLEE